MPQAVETVPICKTTSLFEQQYQAGLQQHQAIVQEREQGPVHIEVQALRVQKMQCLNHRVLELQRFLTDHLSGPTSIKAFELCHGLYQSQALSKLSTMGCSSSTGQRQVSADA